MKLLDFRWSACMCLLLILLEEGLTASDCDFGVVRLWESQLRENPITAPPLLFDVDGDGYGDVVVPSFSGEVWGVHGENGHIVDNWPFYLEDRSFHAGPLVYDVNGDGVLDFLLTTTDAEIVFTQTDNTLLHGETIKIPPIRVKRNWYREDPARIKEMTNQAMEEQVVVKVAGGNETPPPTKRKPSNFTDPFSEFESRFGRHADPLYSRHETTPRPSGIDPKDPGYVYVDPHVLATPIIADTDGDGSHTELVVPVSYYFDPYRYGNTLELEKLNGMNGPDLADFVAGGVVVIDLATGKVKGQKMLGLTRGIDSQPGYLLATPTVARLSAGEDPVIIVGLVTGELHVLEGRSLREREGFPLAVDSIMAQVAVGDVFNSGRLDLLVGDSSGNVYCVDGKGVRVWEREVDSPVGSSVRLADLEGDGLLEVVLATRTGDVWVLNGQTGQDHASSHYPVHLNSGVETPVLTMHLGRIGGHGNTSSLAIIVPTVRALYIVHATSGCVYTVPRSDHVIHEVVSGDIDPYSQGVELLAMGLEGMLVCYKVLPPGPSTIQQQLEWSMESTGETVFSQKSNSFFFVLPFANSSREITGRTFDLPLTIYSNKFRTDNTFSLVVSIGRKHLLLQDTVTVSDRMTKVTLSVPTPPTPTHAFLSVRLCNAHQQCRTQHRVVRFNLHAEDHLKWFLSLPFLCVCALLLWVHRDHTSSLGLPTTATPTIRKDL